MAEEVQEVPRYKLTERSHFYDRIHEPGEEVETHLRPGPHMEPLNDAAKRAHSMAKKHFVADPLAGIMRHTENPQGAQLPQHIVTALEALAKALGLLPRAAGETDDSLKAAAAVLDKPVADPKPKAQGDGQGPAGG